MALRNVLKPFRFSRPHAAGANRNGPPPEMVFHPGEQEINDDILAHPWIAAGADGCIESGEQAKERLQALEDAARVSQQLTEEAGARARAAYANLVAAHAHTSPNAPIPENALDTPISVLKAKENQALSPEDEQKLIERNESMRTETLKLAKKK